MVKRLLITAPDHDTTTRYLSAWIKPVLELARQRHDPVTLLKGKQANLLNFMGAAASDIRFIFFNGHGNATSVTGYNNQPLVTTKINLDLLRHKLVYALACQSAKTLGPAAVKQDTASYIGYDEDFIFVYDTENQRHPENDATAGLFLEASNRVATALVEGKTAQAAYTESQQSFNTNITRLLTSESGAEQSSLVRFLVWDKQHQVCLGDPSAKV
ncbi:hypothetical protein M1523_01965 [Patescibacteria group bacterium]|nr:hypothetical protein [Patescibacteria group bacterium]